MPRLVVDARVEEDVLHDGVEVPAVVGRHPLEAPPVVRHRAAAVGDDPPEPREVAHEAGRQRLDERGGVGAEVVRAGGLELRVARRRDVDHPRHVELAHRLPQRPPRPVGQRRPGPVATGRVGVDVAPDEPELLDAAAQFGNAGVDGRTRRLGQLAHRREVVGVQPADAVDEVVLVAGPVPGRVLVADVVAHPARPRREDRDVGAALALQAQLVGLDALADLVVGHVDRAELTDVGGISLDRCHLRVPPCADCRRCRGVVTVAVDDHRATVARLSTILRTVGASGGERRVSG